MRKLYRTIANQPYAPLLFLFTVGCHADRPVIVADPDFANCAAKKDVIENGCLLEAGTRSDFDACIVRERKSCVDGGVK